MLTSHPRQLQPPSHTRTICRYWDLMRISETVVVFGTSRYRRHPAMKVPSKFYSAGNFERATGSERLRLLVAMILFALALGAMPRNLGAFQDAQQDA